MQAAPQVQRPWPWRHSVLGLAVLAPFVGVLFMHPVVKQSGFHRYADARTFLGLPHAGDVLSNLPFVVIGALGLLTARRVVGLPRGLVSLFFASVLGIGLGSGAYHVHPSDATLALDWLPIVLALAWLTSLLIADRVDVRAGRVAAVVLPLLGAASVLWWWAGGGTTSGGDMRWYASLQLMAIAMVPLVLLLFPEGKLSRTDLMLGVICFIAARVVNRADAGLLEATMVSGHTVKHLFAALATFCVLRAVRRHVVPG